jgi:hypothetical protein
MKRREVRLRGATCWAVYHKVCGPVIDNMLYDKIARSLSYDWWEPVVSIQREGKDR